jgi:hypothetical protein
MDIKQINENLDEISDKICERGVFLDCVLAILEENGIVCNDLKLEDGQDEFVFKIQQEGTNEAYYLFILMEALDENYECSAAMLDSKELDIYESLLIEGDSGE